MSLSCIRIYAANTLIFNNHYQITSHKGFHKSSNGLLREIFGPGSDQSPIFLDMDRPGLESFGQVHWGRISPNTLGVTDLLSQQIDSYTYTHTCRLILPFTTHYMLTRDLARWLPESLILVDLGMRLVAGHHHQAHLPWQTSPTTSSLTCPPGDKGSALVLCIALWHCQSAWSFPSLFCMYKSIICSLFRSIDN